MARYSRRERLAPRGGGCHHPPMSALRLRLLGRPAFEDEGGVLACASRKALWLAAYVLFTRRAHERARLAALFWGADSPRHASGSLRVALTKLPAPILRTLSVNRDEIAPAAQAAVEIDVEQFLAQCDSADLAEQQRAVGLYAGDLFEGAEADVAAEFSDWLLGERTRVKQLAHDAHVRVAQRLHAHGERERARAIADAWLRRDPAAESVHKLVMGWLGGDQALAHYEVYRRARAVVHGAGPSEEMALLAERLRRGAEALAREAPARLTAATSFVGRGDELAELRGLLADPECRLLTLHGLGGVGKTRLAVALAEMEAASFEGGVHVVQLDAVETPRLFAQTLARACGLQPTGAASPLDLVAAFLGERQALVLLDNLEHLLGTVAGETALAPQVAQLLRQTGARVKLLCTSREPLGLQEEWLYELEGLAYPGADDERDARDFAAVQFFAQRARQAYVGFSLVAELPNVLRICQVLEGHPLGLELAASWVRNVPCAEIARTLQERAAELRNRHVNRVERHHSLGAVVAYSWERLPLEQREALSGMAVLVGSFSREAAEQVAHAGVRTLSALAEKSLLQRDLGGRWRLHEVVRQFAWEHPDASAKARAVQQAAAGKRRDAFYLDLLTGLRQTLAGADEADALGTIDLESSNIRAAWRSWCEGAQVAALDDAAPLWFEFLECRSFIVEGVGAARQWLDAARRAGNVASAARALTRLGLFQRFAASNAESLASLEEAVGLLEGLGATTDLAQARTAKAFTHFLLGDLAAAEREASASFELAGGDPGLLASACRVKGLALLQSGRREEGRDLQRRALELAAAVGKPTLVAAAHNNLALAESHLGNFRAAQAGYESALAVWKDMRATANVGRAMHNLGVVATRAGDHALALTRYQSALEVLRKVGDRNLIALNLMSTGDALVRLDRPAESRVPLGQSLKMAEHDGHMLPALDARVVLAQAAIALGEHEEAASHLAIALDRARERRFNNVLADAVVTAARLVAATSPAQAAKARAWAADVARMPDTTVGVREDAKRVAGEGGSAGADVRPLEELATEARRALVPPW